MFTSATRVVTVEMGEPSGVVSGSSPEQEASATTVNPIVVARPMRRTSERRVSPVAASTLLAASFATVTLRCTRPT